MKGTLARRPLQAFTFMRKEVVDVLRQPRLLITLVFGPFLIMAAFGLGYRDTPKPLRTLLVAPAGSPVLKEVEKYTDQLSSYIEVVGTSNNELLARRELLDGDVDVIVSFPEDPIDTLAAGTHATIRVIHTRLDPIEQTAISFASALAVDQINAEILSGLIAQAQDQAPAAEVLDAADSAATRLQSALAASDPAAADAALTDLRAASGQLALSASTTAALVGEVSDDPELQARGETLRTSSDELSALLTDLGSGSRLGAADAAEVGQVVQALAAMRTSYDTFASIDPSVIVRPFQAEVSLAVPQANRVTDWYAPAAIVLLLQQFGVAFGALTFVRERALGITDVFRVAPVNAGAALIGKYAAYLLIGGAIGTVLTALVVEALDVPTSGSLGDMAIVMALTMFASIGLGFVVSLGSASDAQAVQYTLILLLASLFFSGFFLSIGQMEGAAQVITWLLPVSYGMSMLRDVMLRGSAPDRDLMLGLLGYGALMMLLAWFGTRRRMGTAPA